MNRILWIFTLLLCVCLIWMSDSSCNRDSSERIDKKDTLRGKITISGAFALYPLTVRWAEEFHKLHRRITINISAGGAGKGMADALSGMVDLGMFSKEVSPEEQAKGAWWIGVAKDAVLPTINVNNPVLEILKKKGLTRTKFYNIFITGTIRTWGQAVGTNNEDDLQPFTRSDACGAADMWAKYLKGKKQEDLIGVGLNGDPGVADAVRKNVEGIGFNNLNFIYDMQTRRKYGGLEVVPIDLNDNGIIDPDEDFYETLDQVMQAIADAKYPSPPARELYFVSKGKPTNPIVIAFLKWIMTEGQQYIPEAGYVALPQEKITQGLMKMQ
jgi:phosphate transport system substrate-binding protein